MTGRIVNIRPVIYNVNREVVRLETDLALPPNIRGSLLMAAAMATFNINDAITKAMSAEMNFGQVLLVRGLFATALIAVLALHQRALRPLRTVMMKAVVLRVVGEVGGTILLLAAIVNLPLANATAILQVLPLAITLGAALTFGEPVGWRRWLAIAAGFIGVLIIVRPGVEGFNQFSLFALISVIFCAIRDLATKRIPAPIPSLFVTLLTTVSVTIAGGATLVPLGGWTPPSGRARSLGARRGSSLDRLSVHHHGAPNRRYLRGGAVPVFRAAVGHAARLSRVRRQARRRDGDGSGDHRAVRSLRVLPRARARPADGGKHNRPAARWVVIVQRRERCLAQDLIGSRWARAAAATRPLELRRVHSELLIRRPNKNEAPGGRRVSLSFTMTDGNDQLAACAGMSRWCFMTILLSAPR
jgi:drug/metabolite transporter (DMT)-like permease